MSNRLKMAIGHSIQQLHSLHWSHRRIARELGIDRGTVRRHLSGVVVGSNAAISPAGSGSSNAATFLGLPGPDCTPSDDVGRAESAGGSNAAIPPAGLEVVDGGSKPAISPAGCPAPFRETKPSFRVGRLSECEPFREIIVAKLAQDLSAQRIYQDLLDVPGFTAGYDSVKRFVRKLGGAASAANATSRICAWSGSPGRLRHWGAGDRPRRQTSQGACLPHRVVALSEGVQRGNVPADDGRLHSLCGERLLATWAAFLRSS